MSTGFTSSCSKPARVEAGQENSASRCTQSELLDDVISGLSTPRKTLPSKYFYDQVGSQLFDQICDLPEYYLTRTETQIMRDHAGEMASCLFDNSDFGDDLCLIELGSGSSTKTPLLLDQFDPLVTYIPVDISEEHLQLSARQIARRFPQFDVQPVIADFTKRFPLPEAASQHDRLCLYFPGSTIGNFCREGAVQLLQSMHALCAEFSPDSGSDAQAGLLLGFDLHKSKEILEPAYNDAAGVTAAFNLNLLVRLNRELAADFDLTQFRHHALYDETQQRIEMHLVSTVDQTVRIADQTFQFGAGESIRTEYSHKYTIDGMRNLAVKAGWNLQRSWTDEDAKFAVGYFSAAL